MPSQMPSAMNPLLNLSLHWFESWRCTAELSRRNLEEMRRLRNRMFQDLSYCMESYMRSPAFLELMRYNMVMMSQAKRPLAGKAPSASSTLHGGAQEQTVVGSSASMPVVGQPKGGADVGDSSKPSGTMDHREEKLACETLATSGTSIEE